MKDKFPLNSGIKKAAQVLKAGGVVIYPTDTVFGIGCLYDNKEGISRIYNLKNRPNTQPLPLLINNIHQLEILGLNLNDAAKNLADKYWPGALTIILKNQKGQKIGVRIPNYPPLLELIEKAGKPIIGTSANFHLGKPAQTLTKLDKNFISKVNYVLKGRCLIGIESTVVDCTIPPYKVIRVGAIIPWVLKIDTSQSDKTEVALLINGKEIIKETKKNQYGSQVLLPVITKMLKSKNLNFGDIWEIKIATGPGSFTGLRVGIACANALSYLLKIPINNKPVGVIVKPKYQ
jgi:L-threonylcarbamoyladenylate synthase